ncbi:hypothetical protein [Glaciecola sp. 1036]|uniref:hypothetical protein n=1 Tax=Alteromonadaceae TaxID=72275 RepID=UPI003D011D78
MNSIIVKTGLFLICWASAFYSHATELQRQNRLLKQLIQEYDFTYHCVSETSCSRTSTSSKSSLGSRLSTTDTGISISSDTEIQETVKAKLNVSLRFTDQTYLYAANDWEIIESGCTVHLVLPSVAIADASEHDHEDSIAHRLTLSFTSAQSTNPYDQACNLPVDVTSFDFWTLTYLVEHHSLTTASSEISVLRHNRTHGGAISL